MRLISEGMVRKSKKNKVPILGNFFRSQLLKKLHNLQHGEIIIVENGNSLHLGEPGDLQATITVNDQRFYQAVCLGGSIGAGESYFLGEWDCSDLTIAMRILLRNRALLIQLESGMAWLSHLPRKWYHLWRKSSLQNSRKNIKAHYDLGNDFFKLFLDKNLMYSSAIFPHENSSLDDAAEYKLKVICDKLQLSPADHVLEIGTGWGGFALYAAKNYGCSVTTTTISEQQYTLAKQRIAEAGLTQQITLLKTDYRKLTGKYDKAVSIEMIEAIGHNYYPIYFSTCSHLLKPGGKFLIQTITIVDQYYEQAKNSVDFIQRYIFPGSCIPSVAALIEAATNHSALRLVNLVDIGLHYATTLQHWHKKFIAQVAVVKSMGYSEQFIRLWSYYFCYCEAGFVEQQLSDMHLLFVKEKN
jgi:cyclopropane-fatty-acyl-phospholipid synthase